MLSVSLRTVRNWIQTGDLAHTRLGTGGRLIRVREDDLIAFLNRSYQPVQTAPRGQDDCAGDTR
jgi:excisionase family DNA binding protein